MLTLSRKPLYKMVLCLATKSRDAPWPGALKCTVLLLREEAVDTEARSTVFSAWLGRLMGRAAMVAPVSVTGLLLCRLLCLLPPFSVNRPAAKRLPTMTSFAYTSMTASFSTGSPHWHDSAPTCDATLVHEFPRAPTCKCKHAYTGMRLMFKASLSSHLPPSSCCKSAGSQSASRHLWMVVSAQRMAKAGSVNAAHSRPPEVFTR